MSSKTTWKCDAKGCSESVTLPIKHDEAGMVEVRLHINDRFGRSMPLVTGHFCPACAKKLHIGEHADPETQPASLEELVRDICREEIDEAGS